jgi:uncharacterized protein (TIGR03382 family)
LVLLRLRIATFVLLATRIACAPDSGPPTPEQVPDSSLASMTQSIIGGVVDLNDPAVVALSLDSASSFCTGTLVSPSMILTAAHCLDMGGSSPTFLAFFGSDIHAVGTRVGIKSVKVHPQWNGSAGQFDIGLARLAFFQDPNLPVPLNTTAISLPPDNAANAYRHVGFGVSARTAGGTGLASPDGKKYTGHTTISSLQSDLIVHGDPNTTICFGDSGGPGLLMRNGVEQIAGVHSTTTGDLCGPPNNDTRVDLYVQSFISPYIQANDPACQGGNICARIGCIDDPDCLPCGPDGTCVMDCPLPDPDCPTSALGEICQANTQCMTGTCMFLEADPNFKFCTQPCTLGGNDCPSGMECKTRPGFGDVCDYKKPPHGIVGDSCKQPIECGTYLCLEGMCVNRCDASQGLTCLGSNFECRQPKDDPSSTRFYCFKLPHHGGCQAGRESAGPLWTLIVVALLSVARARRRRHS